VDDNLFDWHFVLRGPEDTPFAGGVYHGRIILPAQYPYKPPEFMFLCPTGRFEVGKKICLSISQHHPELWQPGWDIRTGESLRRCALPVSMLRSRDGTRMIPLMRRMRGDMTAGTSAALTAIQSFMPTAGNGAIAALDYSDEERRRLAEKSREASRASLRTHGCLPFPVTLPVRCAKPCRQAACRCYCIGAPCPPTDRADLLPSLVPRRATECSKISKSFLTDLGQAKQKARQQSVPQSLLLLLPLHPPPRLHFPPPLLRRWSRWWVGLQQLLRP
jgi:hypothetical protein